MADKHAFLQVLSYKDTDICLLSSCTDVHNLKLLWQIAHSYEQNCIRTNMAAKYAIQKILS